MDNILEINNLNLSFNTQCGLKQALSDVSFALKRGKTLALVGESGCGKTMTAMSVLKLLPKNAVITGGNILYKNQNLLELDEKQLLEIRGAKIALIPQDPMTSLNPLYTIGNQLLEIIELHKGLKGEKAYKYAVDMLDAVKIPCAETKMSAYPHELSGGMKQRAIIAMALATDAEILIADEPTTALDVTIQAQVMNLLSEIKNERQVSILLITHDLALVSENSDDIAVMYSGKIVEKVSADVFFKTPNHPYSVALLNALPSNDTGRLNVIQGQPPAIYQDIQGCKFNPRCPHCMDICKREVPELLQIGEKHFSACWLNKQ